MAKKRLSTEESTTPENIHILIEIQISEKMKTDLTPGIQNPRKIQDIFFQTIAHITTDIKIMKQIADVEMTPSQKAIKETLIINTKRSEEDHITQDNISI